jgi:hypothetical protein
MTAKELLIPRYEVIEEYPKCEFKKGDILKRIKFATNDIFHTNENAPVGGLDLKEVEQYPHLFRKMHWWERRTAQQMPKRVMWTALNDETITYDIQEWDMETLFGWIDKKEKTGCSLLVGYLPVDDDDLTLKTENNDL